MFIDINKFTVPKIDLSILVSQVEIIPKGVGGIYLLYGDNGDLLYVGKSKNLKSRVKSHVNGKSDNTRDFSEKISKIQCIFTDSTLDQDVIETLIINKLKPCMNRDKTYFRDIKDEFPTRAPQTVALEVARFILQKGADDVSLNEVESSVTEGHSISDAIEHSLNSFGVVRVEGTLSVWDWYALEVEVLSYENTDFLM